MNRDILWQVYKLESSRGKQDSCKNKGLFNGFGFGQSDSAMANGTGACYQSLDEIASKVDAWFTKQLETKTLPQALCYYNTGHVTDTCSYYNKYLTW